MRKHLLHSGIWTTYSDFKGKGEEDMAIFDAKLNKGQFELLNYLIMHATKDKPGVEVNTDWFVSNKISIDELYSLVNKKMIEVHGNEIELTKKGAQALEPYKVKRAVIMAASFDANLIPITVNTPKSMMKVNGKRIIERTFEILEKAEIEEIFVITGYSADVFEIVKNKYPDATFIGIERYSEASTVAAVMPIKEFIKNAYVIDGGILINNPDVIRKYEYETCYMGTYVETTKNWCYDVENDTVRGIKCGGDKTYEITGISYWTEEDGRNLSACLTKANNQPEGRKSDWEEIPLTLFKDDFTVSIRNCNIGDTTEINSITDLVKIDASYKAR